MSLKLGLEGRAALLVARQHDTTSRVLAARQ